LRVCKRENVLNKRRNKLSVKHMKQILFLHLNWKFDLFDYKILLIKISSLDVIFILEHPCSADFGPENTVIPKMQRQRSTSSTIVELPPKKHTLRLKVQEKETKKRKRAPRKRRLFSWKGLEKYRERLHNLSYEIQENEKAVKRIAKLHGWDVTGLISSAIRDLSSVSHCK
jgi:hypothetical protein